MEWYHYVIAIVGSAVAGSINTLAGNGSAGEKKGVSPDIIISCNTVVMCELSLGKFGTKLHRQSGQTQCITGQRNRSAAKTGKRNRKAQKTATRLR